MIKTHIEKVCVYFLSSIASCDLDQQALNYIYVHMPLSMLL